MSTEIVTVQQKHWTASQYLDDGRWGVVDSDNTIIVGIRDGLSQQEVVRLIAAAPDLLEACKHAVSFLKDCEILKAAIAKAEMRP